MSAASPGNRPALRYLPLCAALLVLLLALRESFLDMATIWLRSETFVHGLVVVPISLWLLWRDRVRLAAMPLRVNPAMLWLIPLLAGSSRRSISSTVGIRSTRDTGCSTVRPVGTPGPFISNGTFTAADAPVDVWTLQTITGPAPADAAFARFVVITGDFLPGGPGGAPFYDDAFFELQTPVDNEASSFGAIKALYK